jgi:diguanylate cyclase (GGDEF)-like protein
MRIGIRTTIFGAYVAVLLLGAVLAGLVYHHGSQVRDAMQALVTQDVRDLRNIHELQNQIIRQESVLYEYYATRQRTRFLQDYGDIDAVCQSRLDELARALPPEVLTAERRRYDELREHAQALDRALTRRPADEAGARRLLEGIRSTARDINRGLDAQVARVRARVDRDTTDTGESLTRMQRQVLLFSAAIFMISLFVGYYINRYIGEQAERRRLAMFPERNPSPVLQLTPSGEVRYANPATAALLRNIGLDPDDPRALLPADLETRLTALRRSAASFEIWEFTVAGHFLECGVHWLPDLDVVHAYVSDVTDRKRAEERLVYQAYHDALTDLPNRRLFQEQAGPLLYAPRTGGIRAAVLMLGIDRFKVVVDSLGHQTGDALLQAVAQRLVRILDECGEMCPDVRLYRFEGDLFAVFIPAFRSHEIPVLLAEKITEQLREPFYVGGRELHVTASTGVSIYPLDGQDAATLLKNADTAMHRAKGAGGDGLQCYTRDMNERAAEWLDLENHLRHAVEYDELALHYHPQVDVASGAIRGVEALVRWRHPRRGLLSPGLFVPLAEETGLIVPIGEWILRTACAQNQAWREAGLGPLTVSVNLSARQFHQQDLPRLVEAVLAETGLPGAQLELEVTESVAMHDIERTIATLEALRRLGVHLSVDDFGTGFSSLTYLKRFPIHKLKIDQSFVRHLTEGGSDASITRAVIALGRSLQLRVIAEGVETEEQLELLRAWGCDEYQGHYFSHPLAAEAFAQRLRQAGAGADTVLAGR